MPQPLIQFLVIPLIKIVVLLICLLLLAPSQLKSETRQNLLLEAHFNSILIEDVEVTAALQFIRFKLVSEARPNWYKGNLPMEIRFSPRKGYQK